MRVFGLILFLAAFGLTDQARSEIRKEGRYWVETEEGAVAAGGRLRVSSTGGITVTGEPTSAEFRYRVVKKLRAGSQQEAEQLLQRAKLTAARQGNTAVIALENPNCGRCGFSAEMTIHAPSSTMEAILETQGGSVTVQDLKGRVNAETAGGSIALRRIGGRVSAATAGGSIELESIGGDVQGETAGGSIILRGGGGDAALTTSGGSVTAEDVKGALRAETAGGSIRARSIGRDVSAGTSGGSIHLEAVGGSVRAETAGGSIHIDSAPAGVQVETAAGAIHLKDVAGAVRAASAAGSIRAEFLPDRPVGESLLETNAGSIAVWLSETVPLTIDATVDLGGGLNRIESQFDTVAVSRIDEGFGPRTVVAKGNIRGGGPVLRLRNINGRIKILKRTQP